jgi:predicted HTH domain antitoxin
LSERISFVIPKPLKKSLKELQELTGEDQSSLLRKLVDMGLAEARMDIAIDRYIKEKASLGKSSAIADVSLWRFLDELRRRNVALKYSMSDAQSEIERLITILSEVFFFQFREGQSRSGSGIVLYIRANLLPRFSTSKIFYPSI